MTITVLAAGLYSLVVDGGRPRSRSLGVPVGGAADRFAFAIGNALVGNEVDTPAIEVSFAGPTLVSDRSLAAVVFGAPFELVSSRQRLHAGTTFTLEAGEELRIGGTPVGARAYLCVRGGYDVLSVLGSRSGLRPLHRGETLRCHQGTIRGRGIDLPASEDGPLRVLPGGQADWFPPDALDDVAFEVSPASNRMGLRLVGPALPVPAREMASEPVCPGTVQVTRDGQCIVLGVDGQTIGGYPKVAQVIATDLDRLGQLRPGARVRFAAVTLDEAEALWHQRAARLREWLARLRESPAAP